MTHVKLSKRPVALIILSGFGWSPNHADVAAQTREGNAIALARTPFLDEYLSKYPHTLLDSAGEKVGLPARQSGNSEVSHMILGTGRVTPVEVTRIDEAIADGSFFANPALVSAIDEGKRSALHLMGLLSDGGVHALQTHLHALLTMASQRGVERVYVHVFTDGRDTAPHSGHGFVKELLRKMRELGVGRIASISGRYYALDRDQRWERVARAYHALTKGEGELATDPLAAIEKSYENGVTDEFIAPTVMTKEDGSPVATIQPGDSVIFFNFRADRARQLTRAFTGLNFDGFVRERIPDLQFATFTQYDRALNTPIVFAPQPQQHTLAAVFAQHELRTLRIAETEKYAHVTYFFNGGVQHENGHAAPLQGEILVPSPQVATYDLRPEMSAFKITDKICRALDENETDVYIINFANGDLVGHTGNLRAAVDAVEAVDTCLGWVIGTIERVKGAALITADHGNCEQMLDPATGQPHTAHTANPVPLVLCSPGVPGAIQQPLREGGSLADVAPTMLDLLGLPKPPEMTGRSLLRH